MAFNWQDPFGLGGNSPYGSPLPGVGNPYNPAAAFQYDPATIRRAAISNALLSAGAAMLGQGPSRTPMNFGTSLGQGVAAGLQGADTGAQQAMQRQQFAQQSAVGAQGLQSGALGLKGAALDYAMKQKMAQFYGINPGAGDNSGGATPPVDPSAPPAQQGAPAAPGAIAPGPGGTPLVSSSAQPSPGTPASNWRSMLNDQGQAMLKIPGMYADGVKAIQAAQAAPEGYQYSPDFQSLMRIGGGPKDPQSIALDAGAAAAGALPAKVQEIAAGKSIDLANAGAIGFATTQGTQKAIDQSLKAHNDVVNTLSTDYKPLYENWQKVNEALSTAKQALSNPDQHASDVLLTQAAIQMAVPNATLRTGSIEDINAVVGLPQVLASIRQKLTGGGGMTAADRQTLQTFIQNKYTDFQSVHQQDQQSFIKRASAASPQAINPQEFMPDYQSNQPMVTKSFNTLPADAIPAPPGPGGVKRWYSATLHGYFSEQ